MSLAGCAAVGPLSIKAGRGTYAEAINRTNDEQILNAIVRQRYDRTFGMISVASVTANIKFNAQLGTQIGVGNSGNYAGNLVPVSAGAVYEDNPTISYIPLSGEDFTTRLISPVTVKEWVTIEAGAANPANVFAVATRRINRLRNPLITGEPPSPAVLRMFELYNGLRRADVLEIVQKPGAKSESSYFWYIHDYTGPHGYAVREFLDLLDVRAALDGSPILLPLRQAPGSSHSAIHVQTRSALDVLRVAGTGIEIPPSHLEAGIVEPFAPARRFITIRSSKTRPNNATVWVRFLDYWYYIDATDTKSKRAFASLQTFIGLRLAEPAGAKAAPVVTVSAN